MLQWYANLPEIRRLKNGASGPWRVGAHLARFIKQEDDDEHLDSAYELSWKRESRYALAVARAISWRSTVASRSIRRPTVSRP
jgi:hypothetical protein